MSANNKISLYLAIIGVSAILLIAPSWAAPTKDKDVDEEIDLSYLGETIYGYPDEESGDNLRYVTPENITGNPEELGNYAEGDILFVNSDLRNGVRAPSKKWPNARVPYKLDGAFTEQDKMTIAKAMDEYHQRTCIRFVPYAGERNYIRITSGNTGCWSSVGMVGGEQDVNLMSPGCLYTIGTPIHELMHALGFMHEQNREDRDGAVSINWDNVRQGTRENFVKANAGTTDAQNVPYDFDSVLHYSPTAFSINGQPTIVSKQGPKPNMGQRRGFSNGDLIKLNRMYCGGNNAAAPAPQTNSNFNTNVNPQAPPANRPNFFELIFNAFRQPKASSKDEAKE